MKLDVVAFTDNGVALAEKMLLLFPGSEAHAPKNHCAGAVKPLGGGVADWARSRFKTGKILVFIGAAGIAVRAVAPVLRSKAEGAAVICVDERGENVIPLLSGHIGGANRAAKELARALGARAVITTATDLCGVFAADSWAAQNNCAIADISAVKVISSALLAGEEVGLVSEFPIGGDIPAGVSYGAHTEKGIEIAVKSAVPFPCTLHLIPRVIVAGVGCRRGARVDTIEQHLRGALSRLGIPVDAVGVIASIDKKAGEPGLLELCERLNAGLVTFSAEELMAVRGEFAYSERALRATGADNVCERAVSAAGGRLILRKSAAAGVTVALGRFDMEIRFYDEQDFKRNNRATPIISC